MLLQQEKNSLSLQVEEKTKQLFEQSRMAQMGEMISMIAHQWRQPLGAISATAMELNMQIEFEKFDLKQEKEREECQTYFTNGLIEIDSYVQSLTNTIDDFRNFYKPNKESETIFLSEPINKALDIIKSSFSSDGIEVVQTCMSQKKIKLYSNELMQVVLNILKNAQDNFKEKGIKDPKIFISCIDSEDGIMLDICDNGDGIPEDVLPKIFDP